MFCSITQPPVACMWSSAFSATGSCPCPSETATNLSSVSSQNLLPSSRTERCGTLTPGESRKKIGTARQRDGARTGWGGLTRRQGAVAGG
eukprot:4402391-Prymnesium_polylepis.1